MYGFARPSLRRNPLAWADVAWPYAGDVVALGDNVRYSTKLWLARRTVESFPTSLAKDATGTCIPACIPLSLLLHCPYLPHPLLISLCVWVCGGGTRTCSYLFFCVCLSYLAQRSDASASPDLCHLLTWTHKTKGQGRPLLCQNDLYTMFVTVALAE